MAYRGGHYNNGYSYPPSSSQDNGYDYNYSSNQHQYNQNNNGYSNTTNFHGNGHSGNYNHVNNDGSLRDDYNHKGYYEEGDINGYNHKYIQQNYYDSRNSRFYNYPNKQYIRPNIPSVANKTSSKNVTTIHNVSSGNNNNNNSNNNNNKINIKPGESKISTNEPIVKSYSLPDNKQGNYISQINLNSTVKNNIIKSFKTIHIKSDDNKKRNTIEYVDALTKNIIDPRSSNSSNYSKSLSKSVAKPVDKLYMPTFKFDKNSLGDKPSNEILIWNLHSTTNVLILKNNFSIYGPISEVEMIEDPDTAVPIGMCLLSFGGKAEQAHSTALKAVELTNKKLLIQGRYIRSGLNVKNQLYNEIYRKTMEVRNEKLRKQEIEDAKREEKLKQDKLKKENLARANREKLLGYVPSGPSSKTSATNLNPPKLTKESKSNLSVHDAHILPASSCNLSFKFQKYIANRPFIFIADKYVSSMHVSSDQLRRFFSRYNINRILQQRTGFYLVFNKLPEAMKCFDNEDGKKFLNYMIFMTLFVPDKQIDETRVGKTGNIKIAERQIMNELNAYLLKDIREKVIGDMILELLETDEISKVAEESKIKREKERILKVEEDKKVNNGVKVKRSESTVRVIKKLNLNIVKKSVKKSFIPMSHSLNKDHEITDEESEESDESESELENDHVDHQEVTKHEKKRKSDLLTKTDKKKNKVNKDINNIDDVNSSNIRDKNRTKNPEDDEDVDEDEGNREFDDHDESDKVIVETEQSDVTPPSDSENKAILTKPIDNNFQPSIAPPGPVFDDSLDDVVPTLECLKNSVKTDQDFQILANICKDLKFENPIKNVKFWAWQHVEAMKEKNRLNENEKEEDVDDVEEFDFEDEILNNKQLKNKTGCFKTEGYHKIPDKLKREYLLHRRKLTNLNPVKHEEDDEANILNHNNVQSSRVNRANTRRFVADISAQKQIIGETDLLDLNQLNKRKKPVQFARSAIHNWGLYALEPISAGEMIIEYVGERIRQQVAEVREKKYLRSGIGSSYLFRIDENTVIDASKKGGIARFINHCCEPSCTAKIIKVGGKKRIVIYALRDIKRNEELTYDYKFERETNDEERIPCLCGAPGCKGYLN